MKVDVEIYMNNVIKFFKQNPNDLLNLVPPNKEEQFYSKIREVANENYEKGIEVTLSQKQFIEICKELNIKEQESEINPKFFFNTKFGKICLN